MCGTPTLAPFAASAADLEYGGSRIIEAPPIVERHEFERPVVIEKRIIERPAPVISEKRIVERPVVIERRVVERPAPVVIEDDYGSFYPRARYETPHPAFAHMWHGFGPYRRFRFSERY